MTFQAIVREREDGDFDVIAAIQVSGLQDELNYIPTQWANEIIEYMNKCAPNETFSTLELENVTDVIEGDLTGINDGKR